MARTAAVAGTATAVSGSVRRKQDAKAQAAAVPQQPQQYDAPPPAAPPAAEAEPAAAPTDDMVDQLEKLADMKADGLLDDAEFAAAKARLLGR